jgi:hypothetical protein
MRDTKAFRAHRANCAESQPCYLLRQRWRRQGARFSPLGPLGMGSPLDQLVQFAFHSLVLRTSNDDPPASSFVKLWQARPKPRPERFAIGQPGLARHLFRVRESLDHAEIIAA